MARGPHLSEIEDELKALGAKPEHIRRIYRAWFGLCGWTAPKSANFPARVGQELTQIRSRLEGLTSVIVNKSSEEQSAKLIVRLGDGQIVESVLLPRDALCISTQVGCAVGCLFCMTGRGGLIRQLSSAEIVAQVREGFRLRPQTKKVVLMGMGEPSHNLASVLEAVRFLADVVGLAHKQIVVSSVGDERLFAALRETAVHPALALSLHTTDNAKRRELLPRSADIAVEKLLSETLKYAQKTKYPAQIEWTLIRGVNDSEEEVRRLADLIAGGYVMVNFIAVNAVEGTSYERPSSEHMESLITILRARGIVATIRQSAAQDVSGGCGQLRARVLKIEQAENDSAVTLN